MAVEHLTKETFKEKIFDFENSKEWSFKGENPAIIDFYADWCAPCKAVAPILEELADDYTGEVDIYKINTEQEAELSGMFGIRSIPSILFVPKGEQPQMAAGALPKASFQQAIKDIFKIEKNN
ncbi:MAG: thioredoxin [Bacteroidia bacterium]